MPVVNPVYNALLDEIKTLPENYTVEIFNFVGYLKDKASRQEGCPICSKFRDPITGEERFNAETIAAFEEGDAILRGEIPAKRYSSLKEMLVELDSDDDTMFEIVFFRTGSHSDLY
jgi:hypothetical protein